MQSSMLRLQSAPANPVLHTHLYDSGSLTHVPLLQLTPMQQATPACALVCEAGLVPEQLQPLTALHTATLRCLIPVAPHAVKYVSHPPIDHALVAQHFMLLPEPTPRPVQQSRVARLYLIPEE